MRRIGASACLILAGTMIVSSFVSDRGSRVHAADKQLARTEAALGRAVRENQAITQEVDTELRASGAPDMAGFERSTSRLQLLAAQLAKDMQEFAAARDKTATLIDLELGAIRDETARRRLHSMRNDAVRAAEERLRTANVLLGELRVALARAEDVRHATIVLRLAQSLRSQYGEVGKHLEDARTSLAAYGQQTSSILAHLGLTATAGS